MLKLSQLSTQSCNCTTDTLIYTDVHQHRIIILHQYFFILSLGHCFVKKNSCKHCIH